MVPDHGVTLKQLPSKAVEAYGEVEFSRLDKKMAMFRSLHEEDRDLLPEFEERINAMAECINANASLLKLMAASAESIRSPSSKSAPAAKLDDDEKQLLSREVRRGFVLLSRDWSRLGFHERSVCYAPLIAAIDSGYLDAARVSRSLKRDQFRVLVPGAGAGRLPWELVRRGYVVEGCEESFTALLVGNYALNSTSLDNSATIYPFAHETSNIRSRDQVTRPIHVPDVNPKDIPATDFAMRAGRFIEAYEGQDNTWDAVTSCKAFDLGHGVIEHTRRVSQILKPGGVWAFIGPIPCIDGGQGDGIHLSVAEFMEMVRKSGFRIVTQETVRCLHSTDPESTRTTYLECPFIVARKVRPAA